MPDDATPVPQVAAPGALGPVPRRRRVADEGPDAVEGPPPVRLTPSPAAAELLARLRVQYGELMFHQSGWRGDGSSPMCYPQGEFRTSETDVKVGELEVVDSFSELWEPGFAEPGPAAEAGRATFTVPFWMSRHQLEHWRHADLTLDVVPGGGAGFSVEAPEGVRFVVRSRRSADAQPEALGGRRLGTVRASFGVLAS